MLGRRYPTSSPSGRQQGRRWLQERIGPEPAITLTLLTTKPGPDVAPIHDRLMVVLEGADWLAWLDLTRPEAKLLRPLPPGSLAVEQVR